MIKHNNIADFFELEAEAAKKSWEALMQLDVKDRIRKRKTIENAFLEDADYGMTPENERLMKVTFTTNLSDFKEGECLILHKEDRQTGIKCTLNTFENDDAIMVSVYPRGLPADLDSYYNVPLLLDKDCVDLREFVYYPFLYSLPTELSYWKENLLNTKIEPTFVNEEVNKAELEDTIKNFKLDLTEKQREAIVKCMSAKDYYLVQGPPGTGKSFVLSLIILEELLYFKHKVIVVGPNHMAINNALEAVVKLAPFTLGCIVKIGQSYNASTLEVELEDGVSRILNVQRASGRSCNGVTLAGCNDPLVVGMTPHSLYTRRGRDLSCDTLIIDEAGQMTIPLALMGMIKSEKVIFAGDYKQLPPIVGSEAIKGDMRKSAFQKLISDSNCTMLNVSYRMREPICNFVSELFYEGKVVAKEKGCGDAVLCSDELYSFDAPIILHNIEDNGAQVSDKEAVFISDVIGNYVAQYKLDPSDIAVLTPFRAQAANVRRHIRKSKLIDKDLAQQIVVDTVDKMQGQEREVIIYSMTAGSPDYIDEMADFLYNPNKLNVAFSRAKSKLIIVGNFTEIKKLSGKKFPHIKKMLKKNSSVYLYH